MVLEVFFTITLALVCIALSCFIRALDDRIIELTALINTLNDWAAHHNNLTKQLLRDLEN